jgi:hypothetical protein
MEMSMPEFVSKCWAILDNPSALFSLYHGTFSTLSAASKEAETVSAAMGKVGVSDKVVLFEALGGFRNGQQITVPGTKTVPKIKPETEVTKVKKGVGRLRRIFQPRTWFIFCPENAAKKKTYRTHQDFVEAVKEAKRLSEVHKENTFLLMESILGLVQTKEAGKEYVHIIDKPVGEYCRELFNNVIRKKIVNGKRNRSVNKRK